MTTDQIIHKYLHFGGERNMQDFGEFLKAARLEKIKHAKTSEDYIVIEYIENKLIKGLGLCVQYDSIFAVIDEESKEDIIEILKAAGYLSGTKKKAVKRRTIKKAQAKPHTIKKKRSLGKVVDHGNPAPRGKSDIYWRRQGIEVVLKPNDPDVRKGLKIADTYHYWDVRFIEGFYGLKGIEFGNWLSQQDRVNYLCGLGVALFDLHKALKFAPKQISLKGRVSVAFGARGRGKAVAHFEPGTFAINLTRYSRPQKVKYRKSNFNRVELILRDGGVGAFAHEYGHALDYFGGLHADKGDTFSLSRDRSTDPRPIKALLKQNTLRGLMEKLLYKIIWKNPTTRSNYYARLVKSAPTDYYLYRNEIFARAFEIYVQYKLAKAKFKNAFLTSTKYDTDVYMTHKELQSVEKEFDTLMNALKKHL